MEKLDYVNNFIKCGESRIELRNAIYKYFRELGMDLTFEQIFEILKETYSEDEKQ